MSESRRVTGVDALRGVAVLLVVLYHARTFAGFDPFLDHNEERPSVLFASLGTWGVSLFLVLSGFCLTYGPLSRRKAQQAGWFSLRTFALNRCRRILPPYYAALVVFTLLAVHFRQDGIPISIMPAPTLPDFAAHVVLIHNNFPQFAGSIDGPFWSLGLEWQWYFAFPCLLLCHLRWPRSTLAACLVVSVCWAVAADQVQQLSTQSMLPGRLMEFVLGITAARLVVAGFDLGRAVLAGVSIVALCAAAVFPMQLIHVGLYYPLCGLGFTALLLMYVRSAADSLTLHFRFLSWCGQISYSLYLVHWPIIGAVEAGLRFGMRLPVPAVMGVGVVSALAFGWSFHVLFERPFLYRKTRVPHSGPGDGVLAAPAA